MPESRKKTPRPPAGKRQPPRFPPSYRGKRERTCSEGMREDGGGEKNRHPRVSSDRSRITIECPYHKETASRHQAGYPALLEKSVSVTGSVSTLLHFAHPATVGFGACPRPGVVYFHQIRRFRIPLRPEVSARARFPFSAHLRLGDRAGIWRRKAVCFHAERSI